MCGATRLALRVISAMTTLLPCGCALEGAPFPSSFKMTGPGQFEFVARGNWIYSANTPEGETERLTWLKGYVSEHHICPSGSTIVERTAERATESQRSRRRPPSASRNDQLTGSVKYVGRCEGWGGWIVFVITVRVIIGVIVRAREHRAEGKSSEPEPYRRTRANPTPTPTPACICRPRHRRQPDSGKDRCCGGQPATSFPKEPANNHTSLLSLFALALV